MPHQSIPPSVSNAGAVRYSPDLRKINSSGQWNAPRSSVINRPGTPRTFYAGSQRPGTRVAFRVGTYVVSTGGNLVRVS